MSYDSFRRDAVLFHEVPYKRRGGFYRFLSWHDLTATLFAAEFYADAVSVGANVMKRRALIGSTHRCMRLSNP